MKFSPLFTIENKPRNFLSNDFDLQFFLEVIATGNLNITKYTKKDFYDTRLYFSYASSIYDKKEKSVDGILYLK